MRRFTTNLTVAAALMVVAGSASAQTLKAVIPFPFRAGDSGLAPGTYQLRSRPAAGGPLITVYSMDENKSVMVLATGLMDTPKHIRSGQPALTFLCSDRHCELASISPGYGAQSIRLPMSKEARAVRADVRVVTLNAAKAD